MANISLMAIIGPSVRSSNKYSPMIRSLVRLGLNLRSKSAESSEFLEHFIIIIKFKIPNMIITINFFDLFYPRRRDDKEAAEELYDELFDYNYEKDTRL